VGTPVNDEALLDPQVSFTARVTRRTHADPDVRALEAAQAREEVRVVGLGELRQLVEADEVSLAALG
jgi:hypothetical protein